VSYDLLVWKGPTPQSADEATEMIAAHFDRQEDVFTPSDDLAKFQAALLARWPSVEDLSDGGRLSAVMLPWSFPDRVDDRVVEINLPFEVNLEVVTGVLALARDHALIVYDGQIPKVFAPGATARERGRPWMLVGSIGLAYGGFLLFGGLVLLGSTASLVMVPAGLLVLAISGFAVIRSSARS
jgi:hypothetical protein